MPNTITPEHQTQILRDVAATTFNPLHRHILMLGVMIALRDSIPPHWTMNISAGRTDRLFEEPRERKNYDVLGLKGKGGAK